MTIRRAELWIPDAASNTAKRRGRVDVAVDPPPVPDPVSSTKFGWYAGNVPPASGVRAGWDYVKSYLGDPLLKGSYRMFYSGSPGTNFIGGNSDFGPPVTVSFKFDPAGVIAGTYDATLMSWWNSIPVNRQVYWSFHHEPENDIKDGSFTSAQYKAAWSHLLDIAPRRPTLLPVVILMAYSTYPSSGRVISNYVPIHPALYGLWWDAYLTSGSKTIDGVVTTPKKYSDQFGLTFGICETGVNPTYAQSGLTHLQTVQKYVPDLIAATKAAKAVVVTWFETDKSAVPGDANWRLKDGQNGATTPYTYTGEIARWKQAVETGV